MKFLCMSLVLVFILLLPQNGKAASNAEFEALLEGFETQILPIAMASRPAAERKRVEGIKIKFVDDFFARDLAIAVGGENPEIVISSGFMWGMWAYTEAFLIEGQLGLRHFREWYFTYLLWRHPSVWDGEVPKLPARFAGLSNSEAEAMLTDPRLPIESLFSLAIIDVLLHEVGHIASDALYSEDASNGLKRKQERKADDWALEASRSLDDPSGLGRLVALGYLNELERFVGFAPDLYRTHPSTQERFESIANYWCNQSGSTAEQVCDIYSKELQETFSTADVVSRYKERMERGEPHAALKMGNIYMAGRLVPKDPKRACINYWLAYESGKRDQAALNYGWCLGWGIHFDQDVPKARAILEAAREKGWKDADRLLSDLTGL